MANKMDCKDYEEKIFEVLDGKGLPSTISSHINTCQSCLKFYKYISSLKEGLNRIERLELSPNFDAKIIEKLKPQPLYWKILPFISSFIIFISFLFIFLIIQKHFAQIVVFCGETFKVAEVLSRPFTYGYHVAAVLCFLGVIFLVIASGVFDVFLLSKLIKNGGRL